MANTNSKVCVDIARDLVQSLQDDDIQKTLVSRNNLGDPYFIRLLRYLADHADDLSARFRSHDRISILHIAVMGQNCGK